MVVVTQAMEQYRMVGMVQFDEMLQPASSFLRSCLYIVHLDGVEVDVPDASSAKYLG